MHRRITQLYRASIRTLAAVLPNKRGGFFAFFLAISIISIGTLVVADPAQAIVTDIINALMEFASWLMLILARLFIGLTIFALKFFIEIAKYNNYIDTPTVEVGWFLVRDVANMFFVVVLLVIAFGTILGIESYEWKKTLGKLIFAAIFINFSNLIAQLIIDAAHVFTITFTNAISATAGGNLISLFHIDQIYTITGAEEFNTFGGGNLRIEIFAATIAAFFLSLIMIVTMGAYLMVMMARMVVLWTLIIISPLAYILQVIPQTQKYAQEWWKEFINHVIVAPVMVFFLWLAFATLSSPNVAKQDLDINVDSTEVDTALEGSKSGFKGKRKQKLSISSATSWENLANYLIAIAFLVVGLRVVNSLGVTAGGFVSGAAGFAKNVATVATGYAAGRALVGKAKDKGLELGGGALKGTFKRLPLVGGAALKEYSAGIKSVYKRKGLKGVLTGGRKEGFGGARAIAKRSDRAKELEEKGGLRWLAARIIEPVQRREKRAKDWDDASERAHKIQEESYRTSGTRAGQAKTEETGRLKKVERRAEEKGKAKQEIEAYQSRVAYDKITEMMEDPAVGLDPKNEAARKKFTKQNEGAIMDAVIDEVANIYDDTSVGGKPSTRAKEKAKMRRIMERDGMGRFVESGDLGRQAYGTAAKDAAKTEELGMRARHAAELSQARERDEILQAQGLGGYHEDLARDKQYKELEDAKAGQDFRQVTRQVGQLAGALNAASGGTLSKEHARMTKQLASSLTVALKKGSEAGMQAIGEASRAIGFTDHIGADDMVGQQRRLMSILMGRNIDAAHFSPAAHMTELEGVFDKKELNAMFKQVNAGLKVAAFDGAVNLAGIMNDKTADPTTGAIQYRLQENTPSGTGSWREDREYASEQVKLSELTGVGDIINNIETAPGSNVFKLTVKNAAGGIDTQAEKQLRDVLSGVKGNTRLHNRMVKSLQKWRGDNRVDYNRIVSTLSSNAAKEALEKAIGSYV